MATKQTLDAARQLLKTHFGYDSLKPAQEEVIAAALAGDDVLAVLPTGYGKSVTFQIPAMMRDGCAVVISPLIALMKDQVDGANAKGIPASFVNSSLDPEEQETRMNDFRAGAYKLFYVAPERIASAAFQRALADATVNYVVVDEAHCASMWGHDFRPSFGRIGTIVDRLEKVANKRPQVIAVTATATADIESDIANAVGMRDEYVRVIGDPVRPNLIYGSMCSSQEWSLLRETVRTLFSRPGRHLLYCGTRNGTETAAKIVAEELGQDIVACYHAGMEQHERTNVQNRFVNNELRVVVATNAFGMGIDIPDIRSVVHFGISGSMEAYTQETGRAGRDGNESTILLLHSEFSVRLQHTFFENNNPPPQLYEDLWLWLGTQSSKTRVIRSSIADIAYNLGMEPASSPMVGNALNIMEKAGLIEREYYSAGAQAQIDIDALVELEKTAKNTAKKVAQFLLLRAREVAKSGLVEIGVDKADDAASLGISKTTYATALKSFGQSVKVGRAFTGKTTRVVRTDLATPAKMFTVLPVEKLKRKRERDLERLRAMIDYSELRTNDERKTFIRNYFQGNVIKTAIG